MLKKFKNIKVAFIILDAGNLGHLYFDDFSQLLINKGFEPAPLKHEKLFRFLDMVILLYILNISFVPIYKHYVLYTDCHSICNKQS